ncbi:isopeptide-forming domain-containing fimbrial protein [Companilactobacillus zhachilii]|uniref:Isopeptide-forming domain-containing fimbrial protein n=1 Tax=Companilactobacillus zhachilii TaxID=2304606 RepID=A0A386PPP3_9LACO|nr:DUF11 domain-containing protein [Companilactobacillus zhachilii]AYE37701.1 isopeptide-forming domain-containing fimbrial protein [Companilactobacillus zhachilii]
MKTRKIIFKILLALFSSLIMFLFLSHVTTITKAAGGQGDIEQAEKIMRKYDGITNWQEQSTSPPNQVGKIPIGNGVSLGYTFGSARNATGKVVTGGDNTITKYSQGNNTGAPTTPNGKINIFIDQNGTYYGILHQGANSFIGTGGTPGNASDTSIDFALVNGSTSSNEFYDSYNLLRQMPVFESSSSTNKIFYTGTDSNNKPVYKLVGYFYKKSVYAEIVLRPDPTGAPIVRRELYVYNPNTSTAQFQVFFGEDTGLDPSNNNTQTVDNVPMFALGDNKGLFMYSGLSTSPSKLFVTNNVPDGFQNFMGRVLTNPTSWAVKGTIPGKGQISDPSMPFSTAPTASQMGDINAKAGDNLLQVMGNTGQMIDVVDSNGFQDSAYSLRWPAVSLSTGEVAHFSSAIGATVSGLAIPSLRMTYTNANQTTTGSNHVGDTLKFNVKIRNDGYNSNWIISRILDSLPNGLAIDTNTINSSLVNGNTIDYNPNTGLIDNRESNLTFSAQVTNSAPYYLDSSGNLTNTVAVTGHNAGQNDSTTMKDSVKIPVITPSFKYRFTKLVRNETTNPNGDYTQQVTAQKGDVIDYKIDFTSNGQATVKSTSIYDKLDSNLEAVSGSAYWNGTSVSDPDPTYHEYYFAVPGSINNNQTYSFTFKAKVTAPSSQVISNTATLLNTTLSSGTTDSRINTEEPALVNVQDAPQTTAFIEVPSKIDFGSVNSLNLERILKNVNTTGKLRISHGDNTSFQVSVSYDNNGDNPIASGDNKLVQDNGDTLLFNQTKTNSNENWQPLSTSPIPINSDGFSGSYTDLDLTKYVGSQKWKLRIPADTKAGQYSGKITWTIADVPAL